MPIAFLVFTISQVTSLLFPKNKFIFREKLQELVSSSSPLEATLLTIISSVICVKVNHNNSSTSIGYFLGPLFGSVYFQKNHFIKKKSSIHLINCILT